MAILDLAFATPLERRRFYASDAFAATTHGLSEEVAHATAFAVSGVYTYVRDTQLTLAGLRGSRPAQLIERIGAVNQTGQDVRELIRRASCGSGRSESRTKAACWRKRYFTMASRGGRPLVSRTARITTAPRMPTW